MDDIHFTWAYSPNPYFDLEWRLTGDKEVDYMLSELHCARKIIVSYDQAIRLYHRAGQAVGLDVKSRHICEAYTLAFGNGCEYEFEE